MVDIPLGHPDYKRGVAKEAHLPTLNRYYEANPVLTTTPTALISRPGLRRYTQIGPGPIRGTYSQTGSFKGAMFVVSDTEWWRLDVDGTKALLVDNVANTGGAISMAATGALDATPEYMFMADGRNLWLYREIEGVTVVETPDDIGPISVGFIAGHVIVIPAQGNGINGRFWWIDPGEIIIDPLNFATAERAPDPVFQVVVFGDQFWLPGATTTEVWYFTGNADAPVQRLQGVTFDRGTWAGTAVQVKESMIIVDSDGGVFQISGDLKRISKPDIEQRIREAIQYQAAVTAVGV